MLLVETLDSHGDPFRTATIEIDTKPEVVPRAGRVAGKTPTGGKQVDRPAAGGPKKPGPKRKSKADKVKSVGLSSVITYCDLQPLNI